MVGLRIGGSACPLGWREVVPLEADGVEGNSKEQEVEVPASQGLPRPRDPQGGSGGLDSLTDSSAWSPVSATPSSSSSSCLSKGLMSGLSEKVPRECILYHRDQRQSSESAHSYHVRVGLRFKDGSGTPRCLLRTFLGNKFLRLLFPFFFFFEENQWH